jgi:hypothetical protein
VAITVMAGALAGDLLAAKFAARPAMSSVLTAASSTHHSRTLGIATLITWLCTAGIGAYMLRTLIARGGLRRQRARRDGLPPAVLFTHFSVAITGLVVWVSYLATGWTALAWSAVGLLMPAIGLGVSTVTLWTPYPDPPIAATRAGPPTGSGGVGRPGSLLAAPAEDAVVGQLSDEALARALTDEALTRGLIDDLLARLAAEPHRAAKKPKGHLATLVPVGHGIAAVTTFLLAVLTAAGTG